MTKLINNFLLRALNKQPVDHTPVWIMRQAGRYLPEYLQTRKKARDFMTLCKTPSLACEVAMQPIDRFNLDAAILFSDILTIPDAMDLGLYFEPGEGPKFRKPLKTSKDIERLKRLNVYVELDYVFKAVRLTKSTLNNRLPLIGFSGSPWTLATYMVEGGTTKDFRRIKSMMYNKPESLHQLLTLLAYIVTDYLKAQIEAGVDAVQIFDTWGGILAPKAYDEFSLSYMQTIVNNLKQDYSITSNTPIILFTKNCGLLLEKLAATGADGVGLDWTINIGDAAKRIGQRVTLQGNLDPCVLYASHKTIRAEVKNLLSSFNNNSTTPWGHIFNLGHGVQQHTNADSVKVLVDAVHEYSSSIYLK